MIVRSGKRELGRVKGSGRVFDGLTFEVGAFINEPVLLPELRDPQPYPELEGLLSAGLETLM